MKKPTTTDTLSLALMHTHTQFCISFAFLCSGSSACLSVCRSVGSFGFGGYWRISVLSLWQATEESISVLYLHFSLNFQGFANNDRHYRALKKTAMSVGGCLMLVVPCKSSMHAVESSRCNCNPGLSAYTINVLWMRMCILRFFSSHTHNIYAYELMSFCSCCCGYLAQASNFFSFACCIWACINYFLGCVFVHTSTWKFFLTPTQIHTHS